MIWSCISTLEGLISLKHLESIMFYWGQAISFLLWNSRPQSVLLPKISSFIVKTVNMHWFVTNNTSMNKSVVIRFFFILFYFKFSLWLLLGFVYFYRFFTFNRTHVDYSINHWKYLFCIKIRYIIFFFYLALWWFNS